MGVGLEGMDEDFGELNRGPVIAQS
jgi:hypothetical protein